MTRSLAALRRAFAEELRVAGPVKRNPRILAAFAKVPREQFMPPGPWWIHGIVSHRTPDADPAWLCHNTLVAIDRRKGINNGSPAFWAFLFDHLDIKPGERVFQVGTGTGYYTAILAELVGRAGRVTAVEYDKRLATAARKNLARLGHVTLVHGDASKIDPGPIDVIVAFAGGTHLPALWLDRLAPRGRLLMPLTADDTGGFMLRVTRRGRGFAAKALSVVWVFSAAGFRKKREAARLKEAMLPLKGKLPKLKALHLGPVPSGRKKKAFYATRTFWLR